MKFKVISLLAAGLAIGIGGQANAATMARFDVSLRYEGTKYTDLTVTDYGTSGPADPTGWLDHQFDTLLAEESGLPLPTLRQGLAIGDTVAFRATLAVPDNPEQMIAPFDNGGHALRCNLAGVNCTDGVTGTYHNGDMLFGEYRSLTVDARPGGSLIYLFNNDYWSSEALGWGTMTFFNRMAEFTVVSVNQPAPVPLPMSAGLLGLGMGALALTRRRRPV